MQLRQRPARSVALGLLLGGAGSIVLMVLGAAAADAQINIQDQRARVRNNGDATAISGGNVAVGNDSTNLAANVQAVDGGRRGISANFGGATNQSAGSATIHTGQATAVGNHSATSVHQGGGGGGGLINIADQSARVTNRGDATAISGGNLAVGNDSLNLGGNLQLTGGGGGGRNAVRVNFGGANNASTGSAWIGTGGATAVGNSSSTGVGQGSGPFHVADFRPLALPAAAGTGGFTAAGTTLAGSPAPVFGAASLAPVLFSPFGGLGGAGGLALAPAGLGGFGGFGGFGGIGTSFIGSPFLGSPFGISSSCIQLILLDAFVGHVPNSLINLACNPFFPFRRL